MIDMKCGTCRYYDNSAVPWCETLGVCQYFADSDELIKLPQWVREASREVWGDQDGHECSRWECANAAA